jgi:hypothetical protein
MIRELLRRGLNFSGNPSYKPSQKNKNDCRKYIGPGCFTETTYKTNNGGGSYHPNYESYQPFYSSCHGVIIQQKAEITIVMYKVNK